MQWSHWVKVSLAKFCFSPQCLLVTGSSSTAGHESEALWSCVLTRTLTHSAVSVNLNMMTSWNDLSNNQHHKQSDVLLIQQDSPEPGWSSVSSGFPAAGGGHAGTADAVWGLNLTCVESAGTWLRVTGEETPEPRGHMMTDVHHCCHWHADPTTRLNPDKHPPDFILLLLLLHPLTLITNSRCFFQTSPSNPQNLILNSSGDLKVSKCTKMMQHCRVNDSLRNTHISSVVQVRCFWEGPTAWIFFLLLHYNWEGEITPLHLCECSSYITNKYK